MLDFSSRSVGQLVQISNQEMTGMSSLGTMLHDWLRTPMKDAGDYCGNARILDSGLVAGQPCRLTCISPLFNFSFCNNTLD